MSPKKINRDVKRFDPALRAADYLNKTLEDGEVVPDTSALSPEAQADSIDVTEARHEKSILVPEPDRQRSRVVFFTKDVSVAQEGSPTFRRITDLRVKFAEVHIILLSFKSPEEVQPVTRFFENVWIYTTESTSWWKLSRDAYKLAENQLVFSGGLRADIVVAEDLFEGGLAAAFLARKHRKPFQLHVYEDFFDEDYVESLPHPVLYIWSAHYLLGRATDVLIKTEFQREEVSEINASLGKDAEIIPSYYDLSAWHDFKPTFSLHERYPQFKFLVLHISSMRNSSHSDTVLLGASPILRRYPTIGLVVVGNGPLRTHLEKQAIALGLQHKIKFEPMPSEVLSHLKSANVLIHLSEDGSEDDLILGAASVGLPLVGISKGLAGKLFVDGESARLCDPEDSACVTDSINMYLNDNHVRKQFALRAYDTVRDRVQQDYAGYLETYATLIERSLQKMSY